MKFEGDAERGWRARPETVGRDNSASAREAPAAWRRRIR